MAANDSIKFRSAIGGYNKSDVNAYIAQLSQSFQSVEQTLKNTINMQKKELDAQRETLLQQSAFLEKMDTLEAQKQLNESAIAEARRVIEKKNGELASLREELDAVQKKLQESEESAKLKCAMLTAQKQKEDAQVISDAKVEADHIIAQARFRAQRIEDETAEKQRGLAEAEQTANEIIAEAEKRVAEMISAAKQKMLETAERDYAESISSTLKKISATCCDDVTQEIEELRSVLDQMLLSVKAKQTDINQKIDLAKYEIGSARRDASQQ